MLFEDKIKWLATTKNQQQITSEIEPYLEGVLSMYDAKMDQTRHKVSQLVQRILQGNTNTNIGKRLAMHHIMRNLVDCVGINNIDERKVDVSDRMYELYFKAMNMNVLHRLKQPKKKRDNQTAARRYVRDHWDETRKLIA